MKVERRKSKELISLATLGYSDHSFGLLGFFCGFFLFVVSWAFLDKGALL